MAVKAADIARAEEAVAFARPISRYEAIRRDLLICDAERALLDYFGLDSSERIICPEFAYYRESPSPKACWEAVIEELVC